MISDGNNKEEEKEEEEKDVIEVLKKMEINQLVSNGGATAGIEDFKVVENKKG